MRSSLEGALRYLEEHDGSLLISVVAFPLLLLSLCYGLLMDLRWLFHELKTRVRVPCVVVCVGNITVGGTGKTPVVAWLSEFLKQKRLRVAVVSHGYGAQRRSDLVLLRGQKPSVEISSLAGDEAVLLSHMLEQIPIASGKKKASVVSRTWKRLRPDVIVIDDGFQSISIRRDLDIVVVDATNPWGSGHLLPRGRLRERRQNLSRADLIVVTRCNQAESTASLVAELGSLTGAPVVRTKHVFRDLWRADTWGEVALEALRDASIYAFSGIANPKSFEQTLREAGGTIVQTRRFPDHHFFSRDELAEIEQAASIARAEFLITTEKDAMKLPYPLKPQRRIPILVFGIRIAIAEGENTINEVLLNVLASRGLVFRGN